MGKFLKLILLIVLAPLILLAWVMIWVGERDEMSQSPQHKHGIEREHVQLLMSPLSETSQQPEG